MLATIRVRIRGPQGVTTLTISNDTTWSSLVDKISETTKLTDFDLKYGYPPQDIDTTSIQSDTILSSLPYNLNGQQLTVAPRIDAAEQTTSEAGKILSEDRSQARSAESVRQSQPLKLTRKPNSSAEQDPPEILVPELAGTLTIRIMPDDNSCLFRALSSAVLGSSVDGMTELRSVVAQTIQSRPELYTEGVLEKTPDAYCEWIQNPNSWGGGIELSILSQHFDLEICSVNVQDLRVDRFNEGRPTRCILVYSGIHYDVVAVTPFAGADISFDRKVFDVLRMMEDNGSDVREIDGGALDAAVSLCDVLRKRHYFTDTRAFALKCNQCGEGGNGQQWAVEHARATGHEDFGEAV